MLNSDQTYWDVELLYNTPRNCIISGFLGIGKLERENWMSTNWKSLLYTTNSMYGVFIIVFKNGCHFNTTKTTLRNCGEFRQLRHSEDWLEDSEKGKRLIKRVRILRNWTPGSQFRDFKNVGPKKFKSKVYELSTFCVFLALRDMMEVFAINKGLKRKLLTLWKFIRKENVQRSVTSRIRRNSMKLSKNL